ncbi:MAG: zf-HC2 domain-containing protein [Bacteroidota bacterium]
MNKCAKTESLIYLTDDELGQAEQDLLHEHLVNCSRCREIRAQVLRNRNLLLEVPDSPAVVYHDFTVLARHFSESGRMPERSVQQKVFRLVGWPSAVAACLFLILFFGEQAQTVRKIVALEKDLAEIVFTDAPRMVDRWAIKESAQILDKSNKKFHPTPFNIACINRDHEAGKPSATPGFTEYQSIRIKRNPFFYNAFIIQSKTITR